MSRRKKHLATLSAFLLVAILSAEMVFAYSNATLKKGMRGDEVYALQQDLYDLGFMTVKPTGYYGSITEAAVLKLQKKYGLLKDGIAGKQTKGKLDSLMGRDVKPADTETVGAFAIAAENTTGSAVDSTSGNASENADTGASEKASENASRGASRSAENIISYARKFMGVKYVWGGSTPKGFDCSGFVKYVYNHFDIVLSRNSRAQAENGSYVKRADLKPGDLVFFDTDGGNNRINHVGIYIGSGKMIHSSSHYGGVVITDISSGFYSKSYMTARRVLK